MLSPIECCWKHRFEISKMYPVFLQWSHSQKTYYSDFSVQILLPAAVSSHLLCSFSVCSGTLVVFLSWELRSVTSHNMRVPTHISPALWKPQGKLGLARSVRMMPAAQAGMESSLDVLGRTRTSEHLRWGLRPSAAVPGLGGRGVQWWVPRDGCSCGQNPAVLPTGAGGIRVCPSLACGGFTFSLSSPWTQTALSKLSRPPSRGLFLCVDRLDCLHLGSVCLRTRRNAWNFLEWEDSTLDIRAIASFQLWNIWSF